MKSCPITIFYALHIPKLFKPAYVPAMLLTDSAPLGFFHSRSIKLWCVMRLISSTFPPAFQLEVLVHLSLSPSPTPVPMRLEYVEGGGGACWVSKSYVASQSLDPHMPLCTLLENSQCLKHSLVGNENKVQAQLYCMWLYELCVSMRSHFIVCIE